ncbi:MAG: S-layer homology domain-containing protein [Bacillota bacterium]|nr:S-layer homology domain-containing protein [Bacillota bacterium]
MHYLFSKSKAYRWLIAAVLALCLCLLPATALAADGTVTVSISNPSAFDEEAGAPFEGALDLNGAAAGTAATVEITAGDTAMDAIAAALTAAGYTSGSYTEGGFNIAYGGTYLDSINGLSAGAASAAGVIASDAWNYYYDGWMGAINNISAAVGFSDVYVKNGDAIRLEYTLDMTVSGTTGWGSANTTDSGFAFSAGTLSSTGSALSYDLALTLTLPASATSVQVTATPCVKTPVVVYDDDGSPHALNSDITVADGDVLQIVGGSYEEVFTVNVNLIGEDDVDTLLANIAGGYEDSSDPWVVIDMAAYLEYNGGTSSRTKASSVQALIDGAITHGQAASLRDGDLAKDIVALQSVGIDPAALYPVGDPINLFAALDSTTPSSIYNVGYITLHAYRQPGTTLTSAKADALFDVIEGYASGGDYIYESWGWVDIDTPANILATVAPFAAGADTYGVKDRAVAIKNAIIGELAAATQNASGSFGNANTDAMVIIGLAAAGIDPHTDARFLAESGASVLDGLLSYALTDLSGFGYTNNTELNASATEQGFRALVAAAQMLANSGAPGYAYDLYDFSDNAVEPGYGTAWTGCPVHIATIPVNATVTVASQTAVSAKLYDLPAGTYNYTASAGGYTQKTGSFTVSAAEASGHTPKTVYISLASALPESNSDISVSVAVKMHASGTPAGAYTYKHNASVYTDIANETVTLKSGSTVFDALDAALSAGNVSYTERSYGYIDSINGVSEFDYGPNSGWMYMVNGVLTSAGCRDYKLTADANIVWFYTDDYTRDYGSESWSAVNSSTELTPNTVISGDIATATVTAAQVHSAIDAARDNNSASITIVTGDTGSAEQVKVSLPTSAAGQIADAGLELIVETAGGSVSIPGQALVGIVGQSDGSSIEISVTQKSAADITDKSIDMDGAIIVEVEIKSGGSAITGWGGGSIEISVPASSEFAVGSSYRVLEISADGTITELTGKCVLAGGKRVVVFSVNGLSIFVIQNVTVAAFADVAGHWANAYINSLSARGVIGGYPDGGFKPNAAIKHADFIVMLARLSEQTLPAYSGQFTDVTADRYYAQAVAWAAAAGVTTGDGEGGFRPEALISRQDMAAMLYRYARHMGIALPADGAASFSDAAAIAGYAEEAVNAMYQAKIIGGYPDGSFAPKSSATRAEAAKMVYLLDSCK